MNFNEFIDAIVDLGINIDETMLHQFKTYKNLIQKTNKVLNLTAIDDDEGIYLKHFYDSLLTHKHINEGASVCDIGSGTGFPGMVLAIARPDLTITCIEPIGKRTQFLNEVQLECKLNNVSILNTRAEDEIKNKREIFDVVTARAVAHLDILSELCLPFVKLNGSFIAMKGAKGLIELDESKNAIRILGGQLDAVKTLNIDGLGERNILLIRKISKTPLKYPRNYGKIKKTPLSGRKYDRT